MCVMTWRKILLAGLILTAAPFAAAAAGDVEAGNKAFESGDYATAIKLLMPPAQQGSAIAQLDIGLMYFSGNGFAQDRSEAAKWLAAAARQGNAPAQMNLGVAYATGEGVARDRVQAYIWFSVAADQDVATSQAAATYRDHVAGELPPDQLQHAQSMAAACRASGYKDCGSQ